MKKKQFLALVVGSAMLVGSSMQAFAATGTDENTTGNTITGSGDVSYVDTTVYSVTLPSTASTKLTVDPQGLLGLESGGTATAEELADYAGKITCASTPIVTNLSSEPMKVSAKLTLTGDATAVTTTSAVEDSTTKAKNVLLYAIPSAVDVTDDASTYVASQTGIVLSTTAADVDFILPAASYNFKKDASGNATYELVAGEKGHGTGLAFEGLVNKYADWSDYAGTSASKTIGMTAVFTFTKTLASGDVADTTEGAPYAMKTYGGTKVTLAPRNAAPSINGGQSVSYDKSAGGDLVIPVNLGAGELGANAITDVALKFDANTYHSVNGLWGFATTFSSSFTITNTSITIDEGYLEYVSAGQHDLIVVYDDDDSATVTIPITVTE